MDGKVLENIYQENLYERIIACIVEQKQCSYEEAMNLFYQSKLASKIHSGEYGI